MLFSPLSRLIQLVILAVALRGTGHGAGFVVLNLTIAGLAPRGCLPAMSFLAAVSAIVDRLIPSFPDGAFYAFSVATVSLFSFVRTWRGVAPDDSRWLKRESRAAILNLGALLLLVYGLLIRGAHLPTSIAWAFICLLLAEGRVRFPTASRMKEVLLNGALMLCATFIGLGLCEIGLRLLLEPALPVHSNYRIGDPELLFINNPGARITVPLEHYGEYYDDPDRRESFEIAISEQGFRDNFVAAKLPGEFRILMLGDSFTFGYGVESAQTIPKVLEKILQSRMPDRKVTVINAGVEGYAPWQEHLLLKRKGISLEPDLVILQTFTNNDISDSLTRKGKHLRSYYKAIVERQLAFQYQMYFHIRVQRWLRMHSRVYQLLVTATGRENLLAGVLESIRFVPELPKLSLPPPEGRNSEIETELVDYYPEVEEGWTLFREDIASLRDTCDAHNIPLLAYCIPGMHMFYDPYWELFCEPAGTQSIYERGKTLRLMEQALTDEGLPLVRIAPALRAEPDPLTIYFRFNKHLTAKGCAVVAAKLADRILTEPVYQR